ncbi:MAG: hypothetical protein IPI27_09440 [Betaproteobacteria bacterium]|nr:hypothetical protein [Betaproteobacteria bacterium]
MSFAAFLETAWNDHADQPDAVAARLALAPERVETVADIPPLARLITHVLASTSRAGRPASTC